ncbi:solute carrier family 23 protein, partial [Corallococcus exiguus]|uniref:solute carrier family 23 protein n=1 Tax=Corallococcus exiguus TaxID=83462 RepID=UPI00265EDC1E
VLDGLADLVAADVQSRRQVEAERQGNRSQAKWLTILVPAAFLGFILMSGLGTLIFFLVTGGRVPSYLGSSFAFIGVVIAASGYTGPGPNANMAVALGGIIACGLVYTLIGAIVQAVGTGWIERCMPP